MASVILFCRLCHQGYASVGEIPVICPACERPTKWSTTAMQAPAPLRLTRDDRAWLHEIGIATD